MPETALWCHHWANEGRWEERERERDAHQVKTGEEMSQVPKVSEEDSERRSRKASGLSFPPIDWKRKGGGAGIRRRGRRREAAEKTRRRRRRRALMGNDNTHYPLALSPPVLCGEQLAPPMWQRCHMKCVCACVTVRRVRLFVLCQGLGICRGTFCTRRWVCVRVCSWVWVMDLH